MARQQRTNYLRQRPGRGTPNLRPDIGWNPIEPVAGEAILQIEGTLEGLVLDGVPAFFCVENAEFATGANWTGAVLEIAFPSPVPSPYTLRISNGSEGFGNRFGGRLATGELTSPPVPPPAVPIVANDIHIVNSTDVSIALAGVPMGVYGVPAVFNTTTMESPDLAFSSDGNNLILRFGITGPVAGEFLELVAEDIHVLNSTGGFLQPFLLEILPP